MKRQRTDEKKTKLNSISGGKRKNKKKMKTKQTKKKTCTFESKRVEFRLNRLKYGNVFVRIPIEIE